MFQSKNYGSIDENILPVRNKLQRLSRYWILNILAVGCIGYFCVSFQKSLQEQQKSIQQLHKIILTQNTELSSQNRETGGNQGKGENHFWPPKLSLNSGVPHKFAVKHVTPRKTQDHRGTCWAFATVALLEQTYRAQGIENGWLEEDEYVALSEQAYGKEILRLCSGPFDSPQQINCRVPGNSMWKNSTEGGEAAELYYLVNGLKDSVFPVDICPYQPWKGKDTLCKGLEDARKYNPLSFRIDEMKTYYDILAVKNALYEKKQSMTFTTAMPHITHYYPCIHEYANDPRCNPSSPSCQICPQEMPMTTCCIPIKGGSNYNMNGEFISRRGMTVEGGHVMLLVGYNDNYRTKEGFTGGFILKNSWFDGIAPPLGRHVPRGSHSINYYMEKISDWEERTICPNSHSPFNWYQCGNSAAVIKGNRDLPFQGEIQNLASNKTTSSEKNNLDSCLTEETKLYADISIQPLNLKCNDESFCKADHSYFVRNITDWGDEMIVMCMFEHNEKTKASRDFCMKPMLVDVVAKIYVPEDARENDPDQCGFYFFPYDVAREYVSLFEGFYVNHFDIKWDPRSYAANSPIFEDLGYDYSIVKKSTKKQEIIKSVGPFPFARVIE